MSFISIIIIFLSLGMLWRLVLRPSVYPMFIPNSIKITHAIILFYIMLLYGWPGLHSLSSIVLHDKFITIVERKSNDHLIDLAFLINGVSGTVLLFLVTRMARREKKSLRWFYICWPLTYLSSIYIAAIYDSGQLMPQAVVIGTAISAICFFVTLVFYAMPATKIIWEPKAVNDT